MDPRLEVFAAAALLLFVCASWSVAAALFAQIRKEEEAEEETKKEEEGEVRSMSPSPSTATVVTVLGERDAEKPLSAVERFYRRQLIMVAPVPTPTGQKQQSLY